MPKSLGGVLDLEMTNQPNPAKPPQRHVWNRALTKRQTVLAYFVVGWLGSFVVMAVGDYQLKHRFPTIGDLGGYAVASLVVGPLFALVGAWQSARWRRRLRGDDER